jgi:hypothetical protein
MRLRLLSALALTLGLAASPAAAQTVLLADDMEGAIEDKWVVGEPTNPLIAPWDKSDSASVKPRGPQQHGGSASYWTGATPAGMDPGPNTSLTGESWLTSKAPIVIPADGKTTVSFWSLFQNEGDDQGIFEAAPVADAKNPKAWKKITAVKLETSDATNPTYVDGYCTHHPGTQTAEFLELTGDFATFAGKEVFVRFNLKYGGENRQTSHPCGWYVDDLAIKTTGTVGKLAGGQPPATPNAAPPTTPATPPAPLAKAAVKLGAFKAKGKKATIKLTVSGQAVRKAVITLFKGKKKVATAKASEVAPGGARTMTFKLKKKLKKGAYTLKFTGSQADGAKVTASGKGKAR